ncbi:2OG-Fe(II) oxygenase [Sphingomonas sp. LM7]|uniref:2OG-Fe(II) oxygenase n=1 Tax=Sphingomonas sp. LM7 TaxID=1938607 RepID=UPI0009838E33|nr:2OG-Fe(II) oxygenase [Sphingomonas sp. LM7]AQR72319.1 hypothetical protein BXU08_00335 [Sphingomonas sp. LM7]
MFDFRFNQVRPQPFTHMLVDDWLEADLYARLRDSFPPCPANTGPTGYTLFWGDPEYDRLVREDANWRTLFERFHSDTFIQACLAAFPEVFRDEAVVDLSDARYVPYQESREDKQKLEITGSTLDAEDLWVRVDIMQGLTGYRRRPHLDHRRRAISLLIYFCDADENEMAGGDLVLHGEGREAMAVRPRHNRMVVFPCHRESVHSVSTIRSQRAPRNFVQVTVSSVKDLWQGSSGPQPTRWEVLQDRAEKFVRNRLGK